MGREIKDHMLRASEIKMLGMQSSTNHCSTNGPKHGNEILPYATQKPAEGQQKNYSTVLLISFQRVAQSRQSFM